MPNYLVYLHNRVYTSKLIFSIQSYCGSSSRDLTQIDKKLCFSIARRSQKKSVGVATLTNIQTLDLLFCWQYRTLILVSMAFLADLFLYLAS